MRAMIFASLARSPPSALYLTHSPGAQIELIAWRSGAAVARNKGAIIGNIVPSLFFALVLGAIYSNVGHNQKSIQVFEGLGGHAAKIYDLGCFFTAPGARFRPALGQNRGAFFLHHQPVLREHVCRPQLFQRPKGAQKIF